MDENKKRQLEILSIASYFSVLFYFLGIQNGSPVFLVNVVHEIRPNILMKIGTFLGKGLTKGANFVGTFFRVLEEERLIRLLIYLLARK